MATESIELFPSNEMLPTIKDIEEGLAAFYNSKPTVGELLALAFAEPKLEVKVGMCGSACNGDCESCDAHTKKIAEHFVIQVLSDDEVWERQVQVDKEVDELKSCSEDSSIEVQEEEEEWIGYCGYPCNGNCHICRREQYDEADEY